MGRTEVSDVGALVEIAPGTRASTQALSGEGVRVVVFAFDTDAGLAEHTAPGPIIVQALSGRVEFIAEGERTELVPGGIVHLSGGIAHSVRALEPSKMMLTLIRCG